MFGSAVIYTFLFLKADLFINQFLGKFSLWIVPLIFILFWADMMFNKPAKARISPVLGLLTIIISVTLFFCFAIPIICASAFLP